MARTTVYNNITSEESIAKILPENKQLIEDFLDYLKSIDRSPNTITQYKSDLDIFFVWNLENNENKRFTEITKREFARFQSHALNEWGWSSNRVRREKSSISSMSNYIENILDEEPEYQGYRATIRKIESPVSEPRREKTVFEESELKSLLDMLVKKKKYMQACVVALAMYSGRRKSELPRFKVEYFDEKNVMFGSLYKTNEKVKTKGRGSQGKALYLYVLKKPFDPYLKLWMDERKEKGITSEWLFPDTEDESLPASTDKLDGWTNSFTKFLGKDFYWHSLRHFYTSELLKQNIPDSVVQDIIGWNSADMVRIYDDRNSDDTLAQYFDEGGIKQVQQKGFADM